MEPDVPGREAPVPPAMRQRYEEIVALTDAVCREHLDEEFRLLARKLAAALARKRPSPLSRGEAVAWAAGIVHSLGVVNILFDPSRGPFRNREAGSVSAVALFSSLGVSQSNAYTRSKQIMRLMEMQRFSLAWYRPSKLWQNPFWWIEDGRLRAPIKEIPGEVLFEMLRLGILKFRSLAEGA